MADHNILIPPIFHSHSRPVDYLEALMRPLHREVSRGSWTKEVDKKNVHIASFFHSLTLYIISSPSYLTRVDDGSRCSPFKIMLKGFSSFFKVTYISPGNQDRSGCYTFIWSYILQILPSIMKT